MRLLTITKTLKSTMGEISLVDDVNDSHLVLRSGSL